MDIIGGRGDTNRWLGATRYLGSAVALHLGLSSQALPKCRVETHGIVGRGVKIADSAPFAHARGVIGLRA